jgi:hypothetical protein
VLVSVAFVQQNLVPAIWETGIRASAVLGGLLVVPAFLLVGFITWAKTHRPKLPGWRNGLALSSIVLASLVWMMHFTTIFLSAIKADFAIANHSVKIDPLLWLATLLSSNLLAGLLSIALKGPSRPLVISAVLLTWAVIQLGIQF